MLKGIKGILNFYSDSLRKKLQSAKQSKQVPPVKDDVNKAIDTDIKNNRSFIKQVLGDSPDIIFRDFDIGKLGMPAMVLYIDGLVDTVSVAENVIKSLTLEAQAANFIDLRHLTVEILKECSITTSDIREVNNFQHLLKYLFKGSTVIFVQGSDKALVVSAPNSNLNRDVAEPITEAVIRGPREGFVEALRINTSLIRRKLKSPKLRFEELTIGTLSETEVSIAYLDGIADKGLIKEVKDRLQRIKAESILESGYLEEFITDAPFSPFPTVQTTERPDAAAA
ncbi:MAG TPA: spore germination protein, partial [Desulfobacteria bacterium]|nr:spore germination protein [Desulfobacteria bacterium]